MDKPHTEIMIPNEEVLSKAVDLLNCGQLVAVPTETVYGLAGDAEQDSALLEIFRVKGRPQSNPLIIHVHSGYRSLDDLCRDDIVSDKTLSSEAKETTTKLMNIFWPGPMTLIFPKGRRISSIATAQGVTVAVRQSSHPIFQELLKTINKPLAAPSANRSNRISPTSATDVYEELNNKIPLIIDGGPCAIGVESTVVQVLNSGELKVLRSGGLSIDALNEKGFCCHSIDLKASLAIPNQPLIAPGQLSVHYSPQKPLFMVNLETLKPSDMHSFLCDNYLLKGAQPLKVATIRFQSLYTEWWPKVISLHPDWSWFHYDISVQDNAKVVARELFSCMRKADHSPADVILVEYPRLFGDLWPAIVDRLSRACRK